MYDFKDQVVIVTGASGVKGFGRDIALSFAEQGADVVTADINLEGAQQIADEVALMGVRSLAVKLDVTDPKSTEVMVDTVIKEFGKIDVLINNAGVTQPVKVKDMTLDDFRRIVEVNLMGVFNCSKSVMEPMKSKRYGRIVNVSSVSAKQGGGVFGGAHYCAAKAGVLGFSKSLARELVLENITVNSVCPGAANTEIRKGISDELENQIAQSIPLKRVATVREVSAAIVFLASKEASYITGEDIDINGGSHMD
jgi:NAD(P)-dependent dehydrogenase (short-subunit alcohol dehydrogenase family)